jgi:hypothetical protein
MRLLPLSWFDPGLPKDARPSPKLEWPVCGSWKPLALFSPGRYSAMGLASEVTCPTAGLRSPCKWLQIGLYVHLAPKPGNRWVLVRSTCLSPQEANAWVTSYSFNGQITPLTTHTSVATFRPGLWGCHHARNTFEIGGCVPCARTTAPTKRRLQLQRRPNRQTGSTAGRPSVSSMRPELASCLVSSVSDVRAT